MTRNDRMIGLVDCESFYASCETAFRPDLRGKPIVVLTNNDHWVISLNREAKQLGLKRGQKLREVQPLLSKEGGRFFSSNYTLYDDMSKRVMGTLREFSPQVEIYSIDEAFIDLTGVKALAPYAEEIREKVRAQTFIPTSIGVGPTRALAKVAQRIAKKGRGSLILQDAQDIRRALEETPVEQIWGIGYGFSRRLRQQGIQTAAEFVAIPEWEIKKRMTTVGWKLQRELKGIPMADLKLSADPRKQIINTRQFGTSVRSLAELCEAIALYTEMAVQKLRRQHCTCRIVTVTLESSRLRNRGMVSASEEIGDSDYLPLILSTAKKLLTGLYREGDEYWRTVIILFGIEPVAGKQADLFHGADPRQEALMGVMDGINKKYGDRTIHPAASQVTAHWEMRREFLSPRYTTRLEECPVIHAG